MQSFSCLQVNIILKRQIYFIFKVKLSGIRNVPKLIIQARKTLAPKTSERWG